MRSISVKSALLFMIYCSSNVQSKQIQFQVHNDNGIDTHSSLSRNQDNELDKERSYSESELITEILQQDNEILDELSEIKDGEGLADGSMKKKHQPVKFAVPAYLQLIDNSLQGESKRFGHGPITRSWLPVEIKRNGKTDVNNKATEVLFQQTKIRKSLGDFIKAEVILTLKADAEFNEDGGALIQINFNDGTAKKQTKILSKNTFFYIFNATSFLQSSLADDLPHPKEIGISFQVFDKNNRANQLYLDEIFDVQVDRPFILFEYQELPENIVEKIHEHSRRKRSALDKPKFDDSKSTSKAVKPSLTTPSQIKLDLNSNETMALQVPATLAKEVVNSSETKIHPTTTTTISRNPNCKLFHWSVDTDDIGWFDAVGPKRLDLGYCAGSCPFPLQNDHYNFTLHSFFVDKHRMLKVFDVPKNLPRSCCVPISYKPVLVFTMEEENSLVHALYQDVLVDTCGCR